MYVIVNTEGQEERIISDAAAVVFEWPNWVRICRDGKEDEYVTLHGESHPPRVSVTVTA